MDCSVLCSFHHSVKRNRHAKMTAGSANIFIFLTIYLTFLFHQSHGFEVFQPQIQTVNLNGLTSISCEHNANVTSVEDVRLNAISPTDKPRKLCQKGNKDCKNIIMHQENPQKWLFIMLNIGPEHMAMKYECQFTVTEDDLDTTQRGTPTRLLPCQKEGACLLQPSPSPCPQAPQYPRLLWILIGLLALTFLYSCVITSFYVRLTCSNEESENTTYVEMKKAPRPRNPPF